MKDFFDWYFSGDTPLCIITVGIPLFCFIGSIIGSLVYIADGPDPRFERAIDVLVGFMVFWSIITLAAKISWNRNRK